MLCGCLGVIAPNQAGRRPSCCYQDNSRKHEGLVVPSGLCLNWRPAIKCAEARFRGVLEKEANRVCLPELRYVLTAADTNQGESRFMASGTESNATSPLTMRFTRQAFYQSNQVRRTARIIHVVAVRRNYNNISGDIRDVEVAPFMNGFVVCQAFEGKLDQYQTLRIATLRSHDTKNQMRRPS